MKDIFLNKISVFNSELLVVVGCEEKDFDFWFDKNKTNLSKNFKKDIKTIKDFVKGGLERLKDGSDGCCTMFVCGNRAYYILFLKDWKCSSKNYDTLLHEIIHFKQFHWERKSIEDEVEFEAYFIVNTFAQLRNKLNSLIKNDDKRNRPRNSQYL